MENGCTAGVKALRLCFQSLLDRHTDFRFTGRLMSLVAEILKRDFVLKQNRKSLFFSRAMPLLFTLEFDKRKSLISYIANQFYLSHSASRSSATIKVQGLSIKPIFVPGGATHFRILNYLSIVSDFVLIYERNRSIVMIVGGFNFADCLSRKWGGNGVGISMKLNQFRSFGFMINRND